VSNPDGKLPPTRSRLMPVDNIKLDIRRRRWVGIELIGLAQDLDACSYEAVSDCALFH
jgi:hypothetical protein